MGNGDGGGDRSYAQELRANAEGVLEESAGSEESSPDSDPDSDSDSDPDIHRV